MMEIFEPIVYIYHAVFVYFIYGLWPETKFYIFIIRLAGQITRRVAPSVAPSTGCSIIILILFFRMNIVH